MHELYELKEKLMDELKEYGSKDEMSAGTLEVVDKLTHTVKNLCKIIEDYEYSEAYEGGSYARGGRGSYARGGRGGGRGYSREGMSYARRDSMGRYSRDGGMVEELRELMNDAPDEKTRMEFERFIRKMESMT